MRNVRSGSPSAVAGRLSSVDACMRLASAVAGRWPSGAGDGTGAGAGDGTGAGAGEGSTGAAAEVAGPWSPAAEDAGDWLMLCKKGTDKRAQTRFPFRLPPSFQYLGHVHRTCAALYLNVMTVAATHCPRPGLGSGWVLTAVPLNRCLQMSPKKKSQQKDKPSVTSPKVDKAAPAPAASPAPASLPPPAADTKSKAPAKEAHVKEPETKAGACVEPRCCVLVGRLTHIFLSFFPSEQM